MNNKDTIDGFDFHCHVDLFPDPPALIRECEKARIAVWAVTTTPRAWSQNKEWTENSVFVHASAGLHPELVAERYTEVDMLEQLIEKCHLVGEIGLDGSPQHRASYQQQKAVFSRALIAAQTHGGRALTIHSRRAARDVIELIKRHTSSERTLCVLHWFTGSKTDMQLAIKAGCYFSVNQPMLVSDRGQALIKAIPINRLLTESDAPFAEINGASSTPIDTKNLFERLAEVRPESAEEIYGEITQNAKKVFSFAGINLP